MNRRNLIQSVAAGMTAVAVGIPAIACEKKREGVYFAEGKRDGKFMHCMGYSTDLVSRVSDPEFKNTEVKIVDIDESSNEISKCVVNVIKALKERSGDGWYDSDWIVSDVFKHPILIGRISDGRLWWQDR